MVIDSLSQKGICIPKFTVALIHELTQWHPVVPGTPIALKAINALHRNFPEASQQETLAYIQKQHQKQQEQQELQQRLHSLFFQLTVHSMPLLPPAAPLTPQIVACVVRARVAALMLHQRLSSGTASEQQQEEMQQCVPSMTAAEQQAAQQAAGFDPQRVARAAIAATYFLVWAADAAAEAVIYLPYPVKVSLMAIGEKPFLSSIGTRIETHTHIHKC